jgi:hypothetical protein
MWSTLSLPGVVVEADLAAAVRVVCLPDSLVLLLALQLR